MTSVSVPKNRKVMDLVRVRNMIAAATLLLGAMHLVSLGSMSRGTADASITNQVSNIESAVQDQQATVAETLNSRRHLMTKTIASKIGPIVSAKYGWMNDLNVVHVVNTRFMQHQPTLEHLGMARLDLFKTFTLPSMLQQTNQQFLWIIWTDPDLQGKVRENLLNSVAHIPNVIVLGAYNEQEDNLRTLYGYRLSEIKGYVLSGDVDLLLSYQKASQSHVLVETDMDADDAFSRTFVETAQAQAAFSVGHDFRINSKHSETFCPEYHAEWRFYSDSDSAIGELVHFHNVNFCIKSGMTVVYNTHAEARRLSPCDNHDNSKCCPDWTEPEADRFLSAVMAIGDDADNGAKTETDKLEIIPVWVNENRDLAEGSMINTANFFETHRFLSGQYDEKYFFSDEQTWLDAVKGCCIAVEEFDDPSFLPTLTIDSPNGELRQGFWYDFAAFDSITRIEFKNGFFAMGGFFNLVDVGGAGAGLNIYIDVKIDGVDMFHLRGASRGFWGIVSTEIGHVVELSVGSEGVPQDFDAEAFRIDWLKYAFPPEEACRRNLRALPESENDMKAEILPLEASVLMSRTPTAAGMKNVLPSKTGGGKNSIALQTYNKDQGQAWEYMENNFGVQKDTVVNVRDRIKDDMENILVEAFAGQCTPGHSCKESTKSALGYLLDKERLRGVVNESN